MDKPVLSSHMAKRQHLPHRLIFDTSLSFLYASSVHIVVKSALEWIYPLNTLIAHFHLGCCVFFLSQESWCIVQDCNIVREIWMSFSWVSRRCGAIWAPTVEPTSQAKGPLYSLSSAAVSTALSRSLSRIAFAYKRDSCSHEVRCKGIYMRQTF